MSRFASFATAYALAWLICATSATAQQQFNNFNNSNNQSAGGVARPGQVPGQAGQPNPQTPQLQQPDQQQNQAQTAQTNQSAALQQVREAALTRCETTLRQMNPNFKPLSEVVPSLSANQPVTNQQPEQQGGILSSATSSIIDRLVAAGIIKPSEAPLFRLIPTVLRVFGQSGGAGDEQTLDLSKLSAAEIQAMHDQRQALIQAVAAHQAALAKAQTDYQAASAKLEFQQAVLEQQLAQQQKVSEQALQDSATTAANAVRAAQAAEAQRRAQEEQRKLNELQQLLPNLR